jgi:hypothetical protein
MAYLRTRVLASAGAICAGALVLAACSGKTLDLGTNSTQSQEVAASDVSGTVTPCDTGSAHPNVCCTAGPNQPSTCVVYPGAPFTQCDSGATTYPDPRSCCPLGGDGECDAPPPPPPLDAGASGGGGGSGSGSCGYVCPPGMYTPAGASDDTCCSTDGSGATSCFGGGTGGSTTGCGCACPACEPDSGDCPPCACPACPPPTPSCGACPAGWQTPQGAQPDLCCETDANGVIECFSQAQPGGSAPEPLDAGSPTTSGIGCEGSSSTDGALGPCGCQGDINGHTYAVNCDPATDLCTCTVDNGGPTASFPDVGSNCSDVTGLFTSCGFPSN